MSFRSSPIRARILEALADGGRRDQQLDGGDAALLVLLGEELLATRSREAIRDSRIRPISRSSRGRVVRIRSMVVTTSGVGIDGDDELARLGALDRGIDRLGIGDLARCTTTSGSCRSAARTPIVRLSVSTPTSRWVMRAAQVAVEELDRVLDRDDVLVLRAVDVVHHGRDGGALPAAAHAGDQDEPALRFGELAEHLGQAAATRGSAR